MAYPIGSAYSGAAANPAYSGIFIPTIWSGKLIEKFYNATVLAAIANTDYEGEIGDYGDKVTIRTKPTITIRDYSATQALVVERPSSSAVDLLIDKGKYFNAVVDDVMEVQADLDLLGMWADDASEQMKIKIDTDVLTNILGTPAAANRGAAAGVLSANVPLGVTTAPINLVPRNPSGGQTEVIDLLINMGQVLDEQNIPETGRWVVIPAWVAAMIKKSELRDASLTGDGVSMLRNGRLGMIDRFTLYASNLLPAGTGGGLQAGEVAVYAGHAHGLTFASQMTKMETLRSEQTFGTLMRGLQVYGYKVVDNIALSQAIVKRA
jgi:hypothetical protein